MKYKTTFSSIIPITLVCILLLSSCGWNGKRMSEGTINYEGTLSLSQEKSVDEEPICSIMEYSSDSSTIIFHPRGCSNFITMKRVEGGKFIMGKNNENGSGPEHEVELSNFYIADTEVTQSLWKEIMGSNGSFMAERNQSPLKPADNVTWEEAHSFINALKSLTDQMFRLPTEAEWEFAARGGNKSVGYTYSGSDDINCVAWYGRNAYCVKPLGPDYGTHYVRTKRPNELGLYDMTGNVWEWCEDWYANYTKKQQRNPTGPKTGRAKIVRGGCFKSGESLCTVTHREWMWPDENHWVGVRLALSPND